MLTAAEQRAEFLATNLYPFYRACLSLQRTKEYNKWDSDRRLRKGLKSIWTNDYVLFMYRKVSFTKQF